MEGSLLDDFDINSSRFYEAGLSDTRWSPLKQSGMKMEDIFQVDEQDATALPTLAALNAEESFFGDIESIISKDLTDRMQKTKDGTYVTEVGDRTRFKDGVFGSDFGYNQNVQLNDLVQAVPTNTWKMPMSQSCPTGSQIIPPKPPSLPPVMTVVVSPRLTTCTMTRASAPQSPISAHDSGKLTPSVFSSMNRLSLMTKENKIGAITPTPSVVSEPLVPNVQNTLHALLVNDKITEVESKPKAIPPRSSPSHTRLSQSLPSDMSLGLGNLKRSRPVKSRPEDYSVERKWAEIKEFIQDDNANMKLEIGSPPKVQKLDVQEIMQKSKEQVLSEDDDDASDSDHFEDSDGEQAYDENFWSDNENEQESSELLEGECLSPNGKKERRFFWQYNTQSKGPKGKRLCKSFASNDPHVLNDFEDPVFDPELNQMQYKHNGKARRGDGNDITPSPQKLFQIGNELRRLNRTINSLTPLNELPVPARSRSRKEKNKLASRACRLKKKAQHEANKVKLHGLNKEHRLLMEVIQGIKDAVMENLEESDVKKEQTMTAQFDQLVKEHLTHMIAGHTTEYVNSVLIKVANGDPHGGCN